MDIFDASDYDFLLSRRTRDAIGLALAIGLVFVPAVKSWFVGQIEHHAEHISREFMRQLAHVSPVPSAPEPSQDSTRHR